MGGMKSSGQRCVRENGEEGFGVLVCLSHQLEMEENGEGEAVVGVGRAWQRKERKSKERRGFTVVKNRGKRETRLG
ncbi:hypothetical protein HAX54_037152, partial [Datura stramonium]|nr:hypothetical protein [Datura stramonium]